MFRVMKLKGLLLLAFFVVLIILSCIQFLGNIRPITLAVKELGEPRIIKNSEQLLCTGITQVTSDDTYVYVLFGKYCAVQVYTHEGVYCHTISVYDHLNGRVMIASVENLLYLCDKVGNVYIFERDGLKQFISRDEAYSLRKQIPFGESDPNYVISGGSLWYAPNGQKYNAVLERPLWLMVYQNNLIWRMLFLLVVMIGIVLYCFKIKKGPAKKAGDITGTGNPYPVKLERK